jgi:hypothetical protein
MSCLALFFLVSCSITSIDCEEFNICVDSFETDKWQEHTEIQSLDDIPKFTLRDFWLLAYDVSKYVSKYPVKDKFTSNEDYKLMLTKFKEDLPEHYKKKYYFKSVNELSLNYFDDCRDYGVNLACYDPDNKILITGNLSSKIKVDPEYGSEFRELYRNKIESLLDKFPYRSDWRWYSDKNTYCEQPIQQNLLGTKLPLTDITKYYTEGINKISREIKIQPNEFREAKLSVEVIFSITPYYNAISSKYCRNTRYFKNINEYSSSEKITIHYDVEKINFNINSTRYELFSNPEI